MLLFGHAGYPTVCLCHPTFGANPPTMKMVEDAKYIGGELEIFVEQGGKDVVI